MKCPKCARSYGKGGFHNCKRFISTDLQLVEALDKECEENLKYFGNIESRNIWRLNALEDSRAYRR